MLRADTVRQWARDAGYTSVEILPMRFYRLEGLTWARRSGWRTAGASTPRRGHPPAPLFPFPEVQPWLPGAIADERILADDRTRLWVGYVEHRPVVIGSLFVEAGIGHLSLGVTLPEARGHGYRAAMARRRLAALPGLPAAGVFSDLSRPGAEARGFLPIVRFTLYVEP
ncbi:MAG: hypothetical protein LC799_17780, partial [Actinobacteria bacterium]|nr:hypothetical protein [Actinomycetota bacterium]